MQAALEEFQGRFSAWSPLTGRLSAQDSALNQVCHARLPAADEQQLRKLISKSERGDLSFSENKSLRRLVQCAEQLDSAWLKALTELSERSGKPVRAVMEAIGWESSEDETTAGPTRHTKASARSRR